MNERNDYKKFSIITVCYNAKTKLEKTIKSILNQKSNDFEFIIVDGDSGDGSRELLEHYSDLENVKIICEPDKGLYDAMNKGVSYSHGEFIIFMNAGDIFDNDEVIERLSRLCTDNNAIYYGTSKAVYPNGKIRSNRIFRRQHKSILGDVFDSKMPNHQAIIAGKKTFIDNEFDLAFPIGADFKWFARCVKGGKKVIEISVCVARFEVGGTSSRPSTCLKMLIEHEEILMQLFPVRYRVYIFWNPR